jgi:hypothetical protein
MASGKPGAVHIAWMMAFAQMCRNFATVPLADRTDKLIVASGHQNGGTSPRSR